VEITAGLERRFAKNPSMVFRKIGDESLLVPIRQNAADLESIYVLNEVGGHIWELIDGKRTVRDIVRIIGFEFEANLAEIENDLTAFLQQLQEIGGLKVN
jgi:hypothetical protein